MVTIHAIEWLSGIRCIKNKMKNKKYSQHESGIAVATWTLLRLLAVTDCIVTVAHTRGLKFRGIKKINKIK